jgi:SAM-dependent methyltransferase
MIAMHTVRRVVHGLRKVAAGLRPFNESVWPGLRNDLFVAHESIYQFLAGYADGKVVLDAGCGTGYGAALLGRRASRVAGVDLDPASIRYAQRHFAGKTIEFRTLDIQHLPFDSEFDLVVSSNALEHLDEPGLFVAGARRALVAGGVLIVAVPPIFTEHDLHAHGDIHYHRANLRVAEWASLLGESFAVEYFVHIAREGVAPDFRSNKTSRLTLQDFAFQPVGPDAMHSQHTMTAVFVCRLERAAGHDAGSAE